MQSIVEFLVKKHQANMQDDYVDLDLPSGTLWAPCNLGAKQPEEAGDYYAWGETKPKKDYKQSTYKFGDSGKFGNGELLTKYTKKDRKKTLEPEDDVVTVKLEKEYSIPSQEQWQELYDECNWKWTEYKGKMGYKVASKTDASKFIFLPASGYFEDSSVYYNTEKGYYWSATLHSSNSNLAYYCCFDYFDNIRPAFSFSRYYGLTIRPVQKNN